MFFLFVIHTLNNNQFIAARTFLSKITTRMNVRIGIHEMSSNIPSHGGRGPCPHAHPLEDGGRRACPSQLHGIAHLYHA